MPLSGIWTPYFQCDDLILEYMVKHSLQMEDSQPEQVLLPLQKELEFPLYLKAGFSHELLTWEHFQPVTTQNLKQQALIVSFLAENSI